MILAVNALRFSQGFFIILSIFSTIKEQPAVITEVLMQAAANPPSPR